MKQEVAFADRDLEAADHAREPTLAQVAEGDLPSKRLGVRWRCVGRVAGRVAGLAHGIVGWLCRPRSTGLPPHLVPAPRVRRETLLQVAHDNLVHGIVALVRLVLVHERALHRCLREDDLVALRLESRGLAQTASLVRSAASSSLSAASSATRSVSTSTLVNRSSRRISR